MHLHNLNRNRSLKQIILKNDDDVDYSKLIIILYMYIYV